MKYTLDQSDFVNGLKTALFTAIFTALYTVVQVPDFDVRTTDWVQVGGNMLTVAVITIVGYISRKFLENEDGKLMKK